MSYFISNHFVSFELMDHFNWILKFDLLLLLHLSVGFFFLLFELFYSFVILFSFITFIFFSLYLLFSKKYSRTFVEYLKFYHFIYFNYFQLFSFISFALICHIISSNFLPGTKNQTDKCNILYSFFFFFISTPYSYFYNVHNCGQIHLCLYSCFSNKTYHK